MRYDIARTQDGEWEEDELLSLVIDECYHQCEAIRQNMAQGRDLAWIDKTLCHEDNLCQHVLNGNTPLVEKYDTLGGLDPFTDWLADTVSAAIDANRYKGYIKEG